MIMIKIEQLSAKFIDINLKILNNFSQNQKVGFAHR